MKLEKSLPQKKKKGWKKKFLIEERIVAKIQDLSSCTNMKNRSNWQLMLT